MIGERSRPARKSRRTKRLELRAQLRRAHMRAHLSRAWGKMDPRGVTKRTRRRRPLSESLSGPVLAGIFAISLVSGAFSAGPLLAKLFAWSSSEPVITKSVGVQGNLRLSAADVAETIEAARGLPVNRVDTEALASLLADHAWIAQARATVLPNGALIVRIDERRPVATLRAGAKGQAFLVDAKGAVFARAEGEITEGLVTLHRAAAPVVLSHTEDNLLERGVRLAERIAERGLSPLTGFSLQLPDPHRREGWVVRSADGELKVVLGEEDDRELEARLDQLESLLDADLWAGPVSGRIDLRFRDRAILHASVDLRVAP